MTQRPNRLGALGSKAGGAVRKIPSGIRRLVDKAEPSPRTRKAAAYGALAAVVLVGAVRGSAFKSPLGPLADVLAGALVGFVLVLLVQLAFRLAMAVLRTLPRFLAFGTGALLALVFLLADGWLGGFGALMAVLVVAVEATTVGAVVFLVGPGFRQARLAKRITALVLLAAGLAANVFAVYWLTAPGGDEHLVSLPPALSQGWESAPSPELPDPAQPGPYPVLTLTYGSGRDRHRPEFGEEVELKTEPVDATVFVEGLDGWTKRAREWFWGFGADAFPLNGRVWYPQGDGPFPLVLIVHGNHNMMEFSDPGYAYLGELLASRGFIFVSVDENFLNGSIFGGVSVENDARGWILLKHLEQWREWSGQSAHPLGGKVDMERIGLIGHSRGGEAAAIAAAFNRLSRYPDDATVELDFNFRIRAVISIAPSDGQYRPADQPTPVADVSYLVIQGGHDGDVSLFLGDRQYNRVAFSKDTPAASQGGHFKASVYVYRANHGQFNTVWGRSDVSMPAKLFLNLKPLLPGEAQRQVARTYFSAFLEATLKGELGYVDLFRDHRWARAWLPRDLYVTRFEDSTFRVVADFEEDVEVTTTTVASGSLAGQGLTLWREQDVKLRKGSLRRNHGVYLGWNRDDGDGEAAGANDESPAGDSEESGQEPEVASYTVTLPQGLAREWGLGLDSLLVCQLAVSHEDPPEPDSDEDEEGEETEGNAESPEEEEGSEAADEDEDGEDDEDDDDEDDDEDEEEKEPVDFTVEVWTGDGASARLPLSRFRLLLPPLEMRFTKMSRTETRYGTAPEPVLQTFELPLKAFAEVAPDLDLKALAAIRLVFDRTPKGVVILDRLGFARNGTPRQEGPVPTQTAAAER